MGEVRRAPVIAAAPILCTEVSRSITLTKPLYAIPLVPRGGHQTSTIYRILGIATLINNLLVRLRVMPQVGLVSLLICITQSASLPVMQAC
jgi:hypothetical protein